MRENDVREALSCPSSADEAVDVEENVSRSFRMLVLWRRAELKSEFWELLVSVRLSKLKGREYHCEHSRKSVCFHQKTVRGEEKK